MKETEGLINQGMTSTPEQSYQSFSEGTDTSGLLNRSDNFDQGMGFNPMSEAIKQKYSRPFQLNQDKLQNKMKLDARNEHFAKIEMAHNLASQEASTNFQKELLKYKQKQQKRAQRQAIIGSVLGLGGGIAGAAMGGPAGAGMGMSAGNSLAQAGQAAANGPQGNGG